LSLSDIDLSALQTLSNALLSRESGSNEYRSAVERALAIRDCKVVPFFGTLLHDLRAILANIPSIVVFPNDAEQSLEVST
jgi:hypothetical protein